MPTSLRPARVPSAGLPVDRREGAGGPRTPESPLEALLEASGDLALHLDAEGRVTFAAGLDRVVGFEDCRAGKLFLDLFADDAQAVVRQAMTDAVGTAGRVALDCPLRDGRATPVQWSLSGYAAQGRRGLMAVGHRSADASKSPGVPNAIHDELTGLPNRVLLEDRCAHAIELAKRSNAGLALLLLNLKGFRKVNDAFGMRTGDDLLRQVALRLVDHLRASDTVARIGPDEFALLMPEMADADNMARLGLKLLALIEAPFVLEGYVVHVSGSMGFAMFPAHGRTHDELLLGASSAMKVARETGGSRCVMYDSGKRSDSRSELSMESALHHGVANGELYLLYQPLVDIAGRIYGAEALMRWKRGGTETVSPVDFIPVAEDCGLIHVLGAWALKAAASGLAAINRAKNTELMISVNVSPRQFRGAKFLQSVVDALSFSGLPPSALQLEITEGTLMTDPETAALLLARISALGVKVAVDDFGTGYSSLAYLKRFSLAALKIDRSFVKDLPSKTDLAICRSVFALSRDLGLRSIAEGVETEEQWHVLRDAGCDGIQGYLFGKPQTLPEFGALIEAMPTSTDR